MEKQDTSVIMNTYNINILILLLIKVVHLLTAILLTFKIYRVK